MSRPLPPASRRLVGLLYMIAGGLLLVAQLINLGKIAYLWRTSLMPVLPVTRLILDVLMLVGAILLLRYGWRVRQDGRISDEPGGGAIT